jgi:hypothetical protein
LVVGLDRGESLHNLDLIVIVGVGSQTKSEVGVFGFVSQGRKELSADEVLQVDVSIRTSGSIFDHKEHIPNNVGFSHVNSDINRDFSNSGIGRSQVDFSQGRRDRPSKFSCDSSADVLIKRVSPVLAGSSERTNIVSSNTSSIVNAETALSEGSTIRARLDAGAWVGLAVLSADLESGRPLA